MVFPSDELRDEFHKLSTIMQVICSTLEFECSKHHGQVELLDIDGDKVILCIDKIESSTMLNMLGRLNSMFKRKDGEYAVKPSSFSPHIVTCVANSPEDFKQLN